MKRREDNVVKIIIVEVEYKISTRMTRTARVTNRENYTFYYWRRRDVKSVSLRTLAEY